MTENNDAGSRADQRGGAHQDATMDFRVRSPSSSAPHSDLVVTVALDATLADLHAVIADKYEGRPDESRQTVRTDGRSGVPLLSRGEDRTPC